MTECIWSTTVILLGYFMNISALLPLLFCVTLRRRCLFGCSQETRNRNQSTHEHIVTGGPQYIAHSTNTENTVELHTWIMYFIVHLLLLSYFSTALLLSECVFLRVLRRHIVRAILQFCCIFNAVTLRYSDSDLHTA